MKKDQFAKLTKIKFSTEELVDIAIDFLYSQFNSISAKFVDINDDSIPSIQESEETVLIPQKKSKKKSSPSIKNNRNSSPAKMNFLTAVDIGGGLTKSESDELKKAKADDEKNKKTFKKPPTRSSSLVETNCRVCGKREKVSPALFTKPDRYKCNACSMAACDNDSGSNEGDE